jgi:hypothetical protein
MSEQLVLAILLAVLLFAVYLYFFKVNENFDIIRPGPAAPIYKDLPVEPIERIVASASPQSPNQEPPRDKPDERLPGPTEFDPYLETHGNSDIKDNLRYPERLFGPSANQDNTHLAVDSGSASSVLEINKNPIQPFGSEFTMNGGEFMQGVFANDSMDNLTFSAA